MLEMCQMNSCCMLALSIFLSQSFERIFIGRVDVEQFEVFISEVFC
jgi:hypothetical protein